MNLRLYKKLKKSSRNRLKKGLKCNQPFNDNLLVTMKKVFYEHCTECNACIFDPAHVLMGAETQIEAYYNRRVNMFSHCGGR